MRNVRDLFLMAGNIRRFFILTLLRCPFDALRTVIQASFLQFALCAIYVNDQSGLRFNCLMFGIGSLLIFLYNGTVWALYAAYVTRWAGTIRKKLKARGFSLSEIKAIISGGVNSSDLLVALAGKRLAWQDVISSARNKIDAIDKIAGRVAGSKEVAKLQELSDEQRAWLLVKMACVEDLHVQSMLSEALWL